MTKQRLFDEKEFESIYGEKIADKLADYIDSAIRQAVREVCEEILLPTKTEEFDRWTGAAMLEALKKIKQRYGIDKQEGRG